MVSLLFWVIFGALVGWIAELLQDYQDSRSIKKYLLLGIVGGILGGWGSNAVTSINGNHLGNDLASMLFAIVGMSTIVIVLAAVYSRRSQ